MGPIRQWHSDQLMASLVLTKCATSESPEFSRRRPKPWRQLAGVARVSRTGRGLSRGWSLRVAGIAARRLVAVAGPGVAGVDGHELKGGGRSTVVHGIALGCMGRMVVG